MPIIVKEIGLLGGCILLKYGFDLNWLSTAGIFLILSLFSDKDHNVERSEK